MNQQTIESVSDPGRLFEASDMTDSEVEQTLREIRERVRADVQTVVVRRQTEVKPAGPLTAHVETDALSDALARLDANLATTGRTWSRLPPLTSYRSGFSARVELWIKRQIKRVTHWFTWEQVNFNSAVHHALGDMRASLETCRRQLEHLQTSIDAEAAARRQMLADIEARFSSINEHVSSINSRFSPIENQLSSLGAQLSSNDARSAALESELSRERSRLDEAFVRASESTAAHEAVRDELRERISHVLEEQRVWFKQLSLETSERAVLNDRARRLIETRLEEISKVVNRKS